MKLGFAGIVALALALLISSGCASMDKYKSDPADAVYLADLNGDSRDEIVRVKDKFDTQSKTIIEVLRKNKMQLGSFSVPGRLEKIDFIELDISPRKGISVHYRNRDGSETVSIYTFGDGKFSTIFTVDSNCGIETDYSSVLARIKTGKFICSAGICSCTDVNNGEMWIWTGDKFLKER